MSEAGWHPDPYHRHELRWYDGMSWTEHVSDHGVAAVDSMTAQAPPAAGVGPLPPPSFSPPVEPTVAQPVVGGPPPMVPVQPAGAPPASGGGNGRGAWIAGILGVLVIGIGVAVVLSLRGGSDGDAADVTEPTDETVDETVADDTVVVTTAAPATTVVVTTLAPETTLAPTTTLPPTTTAAPTTTLPPTTTIAVATVDVLAAALPPDAEAPFGFTGSGNPPDTTPAPESGQGTGLCGGDNTDARAASANVIARAWNGGFEAAAGYLEVGLFSFPTPADASSFMSITAVQSTACGGAGLTYQKSEAEWNIFSDVIDATWNVVENAGAAPATAPAADEAFQLTTQFVSTTRLSGVNYSATDGDIVQYERYGSIVLVIDRWGEWEAKGFSGVDPTALYQPTSADVTVLSDQLRGPVLDRLRAAGVL